MRTEPYFTFFGLPMGPPQFLAGLLLLCFLAQCAWLMLGTPPTSGGGLRLEAHPRRPVASPLVGEIVAVPMAIGRALDLPMGQFLILARLPFLAIAMFLGASIWYVARRLYSTVGGLAALILYCFSPMPFVSTFPNPVPVAALGLFGVVFISIAVSHTLYAPPRGSLIGEVRHRWKRVAILGFAIALMVGSAPELAFMIAVALGLMFYLVPHRRRDAAGLMFAALIIGVAILAVLAGPRWLVEANYSPLAGWHSPRFPMHGRIEGAAIVLTVIASIATAAYLAWRRCRYFGNTAPLLTCALTVILGLPAVGFAYAGPFPAWSLPLLFVFVGGVLADLAETDLRRPAVLVFIVLAASLATLELLAVAQHPIGRRELSPPPGFERVRI